MFPVTDLIVSQICMGGLRDGLAEWIVQELCALTVDEFRTPQVTGSWSTDLTDLRRTSGPVVQDKAAFTDDKHVLDL